MLADPPPIPYTGRTTEDRRIVVEVRGRDVVAVRAGIARYRCATFGDVGPVVARESGRARIGRDGRFTFRAGEDAQRITVTGVLRSRTHTIAGTVRLHGTIATGQTCASATLRYRAAAPHR